MIENWKDIPGFGNYYQASDLGNIRSLDRIITSKDGKVKKILGRILNPQKYTNGYLAVSLSKNGLIKQESVHRLVATTFLGKPNKGFEVNHIDEIKTNNSLTNLEWVTRKANINHGTAIKRRVENSDFSGKNNPMFGMTGRKNTRSIPVDVFDLKENLIGTYDSIREAADGLGLNKSLSARVANGFNKHTKGYVLRKKFKVS